MGQLSLAWEIQEQLIDRYARHLWTAIAPNGYIKAYGGPEGIVLFHLYDEGGFDLYLQDQTIDPGQSALEVLGLKGDEG